MDISPATRHVVLTVKLYAKDAMLLRAGALITARYIFEEAGNTPMVETIDRVIRAIEDAEAEADKQRPPTP